MTGSAGDGQDDEADSPESDSWEDEAEVGCPYCGERVTIGLDPGGGRVQTYVEDCQVCCRPWRVCVRYDARGSAQVEVEPA
jgi:hypothetical protein